MDVRVLLEWMSAMMCYVVLMSCWVLMYVRVNLEWMSAMMCYVMLFCVNYWSVDVIQAWVLLYTVIICVCFVCILYSGPHNPFSK